MSTDGLWSADVTPAVEVSFVVSVEVSIVWYVGECNHINHTHR